MGVSEAETEEVGEVAEAVLEYTTIPSETQTERLIPPGAWRTPHGGYLIPQGKGNKLGLGNKGGGRPKESIALLADRNAKIVLERDYEVLALTGEGMTPEDRLKLAETQRDALERQSRLCKGRVPTVVHIGVDEQQAGRLRAMIAGLSPELVAALAATPAVGVLAEPDVIEGEIVSEDCQIVQDYAPVDTSSAPAEDTE